MERILLIPFITILFFTSLKCDGQESNEDKYKRITKHAMDLYDNKEYQKSKEQFLLAFEFNSGNKIDLYNAACSAALSSDTSLAIELLEKSVLNGYDNPDHMEKDKDLCSLKFNENWEKLVKKAIRNKEAEENIIKKISNYVKNSALDSLWEVGSDSFRLNSSRESLAKVVEKTKELMEIRKNDNLNTIKKYYSSNKTSVKNGIYTNITEFTYSYFPDYFGKETDSWIRPCQGDKIELIIRKDKQFVNLEKISYQSSYANSKFDFINHFKTFIEYPEMYTLKVNAINVNEDATNLFQGLYKNKTIDYEALLDLLKDAKYISPEDIKQAKNIPQRINLVLEKNIPKDPLEKKKRNVFPDFAFSKTKKLAFIIAFTGDSDNQILLGTIDKHAFFEVKDKNALKEFCMEYLELP